MTGASISFKGAIQIPRAWKKKKATWTAAGSCAGLQASMNENISLDNLTRFTMMGKRLRTFTWILESQLDSDR